MTCEFEFNRFREKTPVWAASHFDAFEDDDILSLHSSLPGYHPTPTLRLPALARRMGVKEIYVKDESYRFDLSAFKIMGASYAVYRFLKQEWERHQESPFHIRDVLEAGPDGPWAGRYTLCTATDGNHGRAVAWIAKRLYQKAVVYMPKGTVTARIDNIRAEDAEVHIIDGTYDNAVRKIAEDADKNGWHIISDTAYPGYMTIPGYIMAGYTTMFKEMEAIIHGDDDPGVDYVFIQGGVGSFAAAAVWYYVHRYGAGRPILISVEPTEAACLLASNRAENGELITSTGSFQTIMAGLNCGTPSHLAWPILRDGIDLFLAIPDDYAIEAMRRYYYPRGDDPHIVSGESGAAGMGAFLALMKDESLREAQNKLGMGPDSRILIFNTEGATDPVNFVDVISR
jgi:diaminopropionate ammonia-lyase